MATGKINSQNRMASVDDYSTDEGEDDESAMSLVDHLEELRWRILKSLIAIVVGGIIAFIFRDPIIQFLQLPLPAQASAAQLVGQNGHVNRLITTGLAEGFTVYLKLSLAVGFLLGLPVTLYQTWAFISPGLFAREKKYAVPFIFIGIVLFVVGIALGFVVLRFPVNWLVAIAADNFTELITADSYFTFVAFFMLAFGIVFEIPLVLTFLAQIGVITADTLKKRRAASHVGMWIAATFLTPGADIYSPIILGVAMSFLFELTIVFIRLFTKK
jgi:sec-independent protein translocase protein TatC